MFFDLHAAKGKRKDYRSSLLIIDHTVHVIEYKTALHMFLFLCCAIHM